jgi:serine/threonine-protein kinase
MSKERQLEDFLTERFELLGGVGKGGMGEVLQVKEKATGQDFALKQLLNTAGGKAATPALFKREFEILSKMDHPNIVKVYELFEGNKTLSYSMDFLPGKTLKDWLLEPGKKGQRGNEAVALDLLLQLARALHHVHEREILHHDVHPHNVKLIENKACKGGLQVKLLDFGISLLKEQQSQREITIGASNYKSPEQYRGEKLDYTADIYCFGSIAYEVLTGKQPFDISIFRENMFASMRAEFVMHALKDVPEIKNLNKKVAKEINMMIQICMEKEPEDRYQSMQDVSERLELTLSKL